MKNKITKALEPHLKPLKNKIDQLPEKDRLYLYTLSIFGAVLIFIYAIYLPLADFHDKSIQQATIKQELYEWLKSKEPQARAQQKSPKAASSNQSLLTLATNSAKNNGLNLKRVEPEGNDRIRLWIEDAPFNQVLIALDKLQNEHGLQIEEVSVDRKAPGKVDARATISR